MRGAASLAPLRDAPFRRLFTARTVSATGDALIPVALTFAVLESGGGATDVGLVLAAGVIGQVALLLVAGVWSDRLPRRLLLIGSDLVQAAAYVVMAALLLTGSATVTHLVLLRLLTGAASAFFLTSSGALVAELVEPTLLQQANALLGLARSTTMVGGPLIAGLLVAVADPGAAIAIDAATFVVSALALVGLVVPPRTPAERRAFRRELGEGWAAMWSKPWYPLNLAAHGAWVFGSAFFFVLGPVVAEAELGGAADWGVVSAGLGAGLVVGGLLALNLRPRHPLVAANLALVPAALPVAALAGPAPAWALALLAGVGWAGLAFLNEVWGATVQQLFPADVLGRVDSFDWFLSILTLPLGYVVAGPVSDLLGRGPALLLAASLLAVPSLAICLVPGVRAIRRTPEGAIVEG